MVRIVYNREPDSLAAECHRFWHVQYGQRIGRQFPQGERILI